ncbi:uncharacterized protein LOC135344107 [Halichondria panicea]|uniref:uncharacterized protein LOC135344107 n=1 Tax=Halichondria panicea TaxID=6063 RepID=UPI00312B70B4
MAQKPKELFSGVLQKCGGKYKSWNKRFFILKDDYCLYYYKDTSKGHLGAISLRDTKFKVRKGEASDVSWPKAADLVCCFAIVTNQRTYCMYSDRQDETDDWIRMLQGARDKLLSENLDANRLMGGQRSQSTSMVGSNGTIEEQSSDTGGRPHSEEMPRPPDLEVPRPPNGTERQLTYEEMNPAPSDIDECPEAFYDVAKPIEQLYTDPEKDRSRFNSDNLEPVYDQAVQVTDEPSDLYEEVGPDSSITSIKSQPLPPIPKVVATDTELALYEDISQLGDQPLYASVSEESLKVNSGREKIKDIENSGEFPTTTTNEAPPLPPKDDFPPLPPRDNLPPLPPKDDSPPLPPKEDSSPLPPRVISPPLPPKEDESSVAITTPSLLPAKESPDLKLKSDWPLQENNSAYYDDVEEVMNEVNKIQLSELDNGTPPTPRKVNGYHTPPSHDSPTSQHTPPSPHTPPTPRKRTLTPPTPRKISQTELPPSPHKPRTPPSPHKLGTPPSPHKPRTPPSSHTPHKLDTPPSHHKPRTPPSSHTPNKICTPPSPHKPHTPDTPPTPHTPHKPRTPPSPLKPHTPDTPTSPSLSTPHTPPRSPKPSPTPRRKLMKISEPAPEEQSNTVTCPLSPDRGHNLFLSRQKLSQGESKRRADTVQLTSDPTLTSIEKASIASTLREVEKERLMASEERFLLERERKKFEDERRKFEEEKRLLQEQLSNAKKQLDQTKT